MRKRPTQDLAFRSSRAARGAHLASALGLAIGLVSARARADLRGVAAGGAGQDGLEAVVDTKDAVVRVRRCKAADCSDPASASDVRSTPIPIAAARLDASRVTVAAIPIGEGRTVLHVRVPDRERPDLAFELVASAQSEEPIFAGLTGYTAGAEGDRSGSVVLVYDRDAQSKFVIVAETREDTRICGQSVTPLAARGLDPRAMALRGASLHRLDKAARDGATRIVAQASPEAAMPPLARAVVATGASAPNGAKLTDGQRATVWSEARPGDGHGEFVTMRTTRDLPLSALRVTIAPEGAPPSPTGAAPRTFFVATDDQLFHVVMPEDAWPLPGKSYDVPFPGELRTNCVAVVLDEAYARGLAAPEVSIAEVSALSRFDAENATLEDVAKALGTARSEEAAALLRRSGDAGLAAVLAHLPELDARGRALAVDVAASAGSCEGAAIDLLGRALTDKDVEVKKRALGRIERCGKAAAPALATALAGDDEGRRAAIAPVLASVAPSLALAPLGAQLGKGAKETRRAVRSAFARAAGSAPKDRLLAILQGVTRPEAGSPGPDLATRLDVLRGMGARLVDLRPEADVAIAQVLRGGAPDLATRWLLVQPLATLARAPDATTGALTTLAELVRRDPDWQVRARAVELAVGIAPLTSAILGATADPEPRVREAALRAVGVAALPSGARPAGAALASDPWTFVRLAAAEAIAALPQDAAAEADLANALRDASPRVRSAATLALAKVRATGAVPKIRARLDDAREDADVRASAALALGILCDRSAVPRLTKLAMLAQSPVDEADDRVGTAAIEALGALHPGDLERRLAPLRTKDARLPVRRAAERALATPGACR
jgi:HEAT repeat protein